MFLKKINTLGATNKSYKGFQPLHLKKVWCNYVPIVFVTYIFPQPYFIDWMTDPYSYFKIL